MKSNQKLTQVAAQGDLNAMRTLLKADKSLAQEWKPIMDACFYGQADAVALLLKNGADPNIRSPQNYRPLHRAVEHKKTAPKRDEHKKVVGHLLSAGADPIARGAYGNISAIAVCATGESHSHFTKLLRSAPKPLDIYHACVLADVTRVKALLKKDASLAGAVDSESRDWTPLKYCAQSCLGHSDAKKAADLADIAQLLIDNGADTIGIVDVAAYGGNLSVLECVLRAGGKVQDDDWLNHTACEGGFAALELIHKYGLPLDKTDGTDHHGGYTPLGCAVSCRSVKGAKWFMDHGQDPNKIKSKNGENCLHVAINWKASDKMLQLLLDYGAKLNQKDKQGHTPLKLAREKKHKKAIAFLEDVNAKD